MQLLKAVSSSCGPEQSLVNEMVCPTEECPLPSQAYPKRGSCCLATLSAADHSSV